MRRDTAATPRSVFVIRMRLAARAPPPPYFADRDLLQLIAFWSLQVLDRSFYLHVFVCVLFLHVSAYICMLLTFSVSSFRASAALALGKCCCRKATKTLPESIQIHPKSIKNPSQIHPKPITLVARNDPKATLRASPQAVIPQGIFGSNFWRHLGDFGRHFGHRRVPMGCQNRAFWHQGASKVGNLRSRKGFLEKG